MDALPRLTDLLRRQPIEVHKLVAEVVRRKNVANVLKELRKVLRGLDEVALDVLSGLLVGRHVMVVGPVGLGKTTLVETIAEIINLADPPYVEVACHSHMTASELTGDIDIAVALQSGLDHPLAYIPGPLVLAHGKFLVMDEINRLNPYSQAALLQALQEHYVFIRGFRVRTDFLLLATSNPSEYSGVYELSEALADRMKVVEITYPDREVLKAIIVWKTEQAVEHLGVSVPEPMADILATYAGLLSKDGNVEVGPSIRSMTYSLSSAIARAWLQGREPTVYDLKRETVSNLAGVIRGDFQSDSAKTEYLARKFDEAVVLHRRQQRF